MIYAPILTGDSWRGLAIRWIRAVRAEHCVFGNESVWHWWFFTFIACIQLFGAICCNCFLSFFLTLARPHKHAAIHNIWIYIVLYSYKHTLSPVLSPPQNAFCTLMQEEISKSCCLWKRKSFTNQSTCHMWKIMRIVQILASNVKNHCRKIRLKKEKQITNNKQKQTHYTQLVVNEDCFWNCSNFFN